MQRHNCLIFMQPPVLLGICTPAAPFYLLLYEQYWIGENEGRRRDLKRLVDDNYRER
jgi:hypothetical protein